MRVTTVNVARGLDNELLDELAALTPRDATHFRGSEADRCSRLPKASEKRARPCSPTLARRRTEQQEICNQSISRRLIA